MSILSAAIVSILTNATLFIFAAALVLLVLWQNANNRSNRYFGLCMVVFMAFGGVNLLWSIAQRVDTAHPERLLYGAVTLYITGIMLLFNFVISFAGLPRYIRWIERAISIPLAITWGSRTTSAAEATRANGTSASVNTPLQCSDVSVWSRSWMRARIASWSARRCSAYLRNCSRNTSATQVRACSVMNPASTATGRVE